MFNQKIIAGVLTSIGLFSVVTAITYPFQVTAQTSNGSAMFEMNIDLNRAKNLARMAAEKANGGLGMYRAESKMHGFPTETDYVEDDTTWTFTFLGYQVINGVLMDQPTIESVVTVSKDGQLVDVIYNGEIRN